jgi:hypothetical protein
MHYTAPHDDGISEPIDRPLGVIDGKADRRSKLFLHES